MNSFIKPFIIKFIKLFVFIILFCLFSNNIFAATITSTSAGGTWATAGTWVGNTVPATGDNVIIATTGGATVNIAANITQTAVGSVTINNGAILTTSGGAITFGALTLNTGSSFTANRQLTIRGATNISGTINFGSTNTTVRAMTFNGAVTLNSGAIWNETTTGAAATFTFANSFSNSATTFTSQATTHSFSGAGMTFNGTTATSIPTVTITGSYTNNGILTASTSLTGAGSLINGATGTLNIGAAENITTLTTSAVGNTVNYYGAAQTVNPGTFSNLTLSGTNAKTLTGVTAVGANLVLSGTATATTASNMTVGALQIGTGTTLTTGNNLTLAVSGTSNITGSLVLGGTGAKTFTGDVTLNSGGVWNETGIATVNFGGSITNNATTFTANTGTHNFTGVSKTLTGSLNTSIPTVNITGSYTNNGILTASTSLTGAGSLINGATGTLNIGAAENITTLTTSAVGNTVNYNGAAQTVRSQNYSNLTLSGSGIKSLLTGTTNIGSNLTFSGTASATAAVGLTVGSNVIIGTGSTFNGSTFTHTIAGNWTNNGGTFMPATSTISLTGVASQIGGTLSPQNFYNLTVGSGTTTIATVATTSNILTVNTGTNLIISGANSLTPTSAIISGTVTVTGSLIKGSGITQFNSGSTYTHNRDGGAIPISLWDVNSTCSITGVIATMPTVTTFFQSFGNFDWNCLSQTADLTFQGQLLDINGNFTIQNTGSGSIRLANGGGNYAVNVDGNFNQSNGRFFVFGNGTGTGFTGIMNVLGDFTMSNGTLDLSATNGTGIVNVARNFSFTNGTITESGTGTANFNFNGTTTQLYSKTGGAFTNTVNFGIDTNSIVDFGTSLLDGSLGTFNLLGSGTVLTKNTGGFALSGATGTVQVSGSRVYSATANYEYNGTLAQVTGTGLVTANNITINNTAGVSLSASTTVNNQLTLTSGKLNLNTFNLTLGANALAISGSFSNTSMIVASGTGQVRKLLTVLDLTHPYTFPIGDNITGDDYTPINITINSATLAPGALVAVNVTNAKHPNNASTINYLDRYWTINQTGITNMQADVTATFVTADIPLGSTFSNIITSRYVAPEWVEQNVATANTISANSLIAFGDFTGRNNLPILNVTPSTLIDFTYLSGYGPSTQKSFIVSGSALTTNITILPPDSFEISTLSGTSFSPSPIITVNVVNREVSATTIYVRLKAGFNVGNIVSENIQCSSTGVTTVNVNCSGSVTNAPLISPSVSQLTNFSYRLGAGPSLSQSFTLNGTYLIDNIVVTAPTNYEIQSGLPAYVSTLSFTPAQIPAQINVRLKAGLLVSNYNENIVLTTASGLTQTVQCEGAVNTASVAVSKFTLAGFIYTVSDGLPSSVQSFIATGTNLTGNLVVTPPTNFEISTDSINFTLAAISIAPVSNAASSKIYVRMRSTLPLGPVASQKITVSSTGAISQTVACSGQVVNTPTTISSIGTLNGFFYISGLGPSTKQTVNISATGLSSPITVTAPVHYEISLTGADNSFISNGGTFTIPNVDGKVNAVPVYIRLKSGWPVGDYNSENVQLTATGANAVNVVCNGKVVVAPTIVAGPNDLDPTCPNQNITLTASGTGFTNVTWTGPNGFYSTLQNPPLGVVTATNNGTYTVTGTSSSGVNLITNGDFELGNVDFGSTYTFRDIGGTSNPYGVYWVKASPSEANSAYFLNTADHTTTGTFQMIVDGSETPGTVIWSQTISVSPNSDFLFSYFGQNVNNTTDTNYGKLQLYVNNIPYGAVNTLSVKAWVEFKANINVGNNSTIQLTLINTHIGGQGNDFAIDDISFQQVVQVSSSVTLNVVPTLAPALVVTASENPVFANTIVTYTATPTNGGTTPTYQWKVNGINQGLPTTSKTFEYIPLQGDSVSCVMTSNYKCISPQTAANYVKMDVNPRTNYWRGNISTDWGTPGNWTGGFVPLAGDDVEFAKKSNNNEVPAERNLQLDINRTIGYLINDSASLSVIIPPNLTLIVNNSIQSTSNPDKVIVQASTSLPNGSIIYRNSQSLPVYGTVEMYSPASWNKLGGFNNVYNWQYFGIPLTSLPALPTFYGAYVRQLLEHKDKIENHWESLTNQSVLIPFKGYELCQQNPNTLYLFKGQLVNSNYSSGQFVKTTTGNPLFPGQHLFANPYTSAIDIRQIEFGTGVEATAYLYNTGTFLSWQNNPIKSGTLTDPAPGQYFAAPKNQAGTINGIPRQIPSMGSFMVRIPKDSVSKSTSYININYNNVAMGNSSRQTVKLHTYADEQTLTTIQADGEFGMDRMWIATQDNYSRSFDNGYDGFKMTGAAINPQLYAVEEDGNYQINSIDDINNCTIAFMAGQDTEYSLRINHDEKTVAKYNKIYLHDLLENKIIDISLIENVYTFNATSTPAPVLRFKIIAQKFTDESTKVSNVKVYNFDNHIYVQNFSALSGKVYVYDISGRTVGIKAISSNQNIQIAAPKNNIYIVKIVVGSITETTKIFIQ